MPIATNNPRQADIFLLRCAQNAKIRRCLGRYANSYTQVKYMGKKLQDRDGPVFGISNSADLFEKLKRDSLNLCTDWNPYDAFNFLITAWHLHHDWVKSDHPNALSRIKRRKVNLPKEMNLVLDIIKDLGNGSKHFKLDPEPASKRQVSEVHTGSEVGWYEYFFHENLPAVTANGNWYFSIRVLHNIVMRYFYWVFDDTSDSKNFPNEIIEAISFCNIANRKSGATPEICLLNLK